MPRIDVQAELLHKLDAQKPAVLSQPRIRVAVDSTLKGAIPFAGVKDAYSPGNMHTALIIVS
jgi:hypothetical protein